MAPEQSLKQQAADTFDCAGEVDPTLNLIKGGGARLDGRTGIVAHGLLLGLATEVIVAGASGMSYLKREN